MGTWDCVETDFGDETGNFGPRQESGSALYEVNTIATIGSREQTTQCTKPQLSCSVIGDRIGLAADQHLSVFRDLQFSQTMEFDNKIDALAWSPDEAFLVLCDCHGTLWAVEAESLNIIFSTEILPPSKTGGKAFQQILVKKLKIGYDILILSSSAHLFVIRKVTPAILADSSKSLRERVTIEMADTSSVHKSQTHSIFCLENNIVTLGSGESIIGVWSSVDGRLEPVDEAGSFLEGDAGIVTGCCSTNTKFLILLDEKNRMTVWDAFLLTLLSVWEEEKVDSFFLLETDDNNINSLLGVKVVMLTREGGGNCCLQVKNLPSWETSYKLQLYPTQLADTLPNQESLYIVEWCNKDDKTDVKVLRLRCLTEALPETRLTRLLNKNRFDEAMEFAKLFRLDTELVCKVKCKYLLDQLSSWNVACYEAEQVTQMIADLHECLAAISDVPYIVSSLTSAALPTIADTHTVLLYVKKRMQAYLASSKEMTDGQRKKASADMNKLLGVIYRLTTFKQAFGQNHYTAERWERFMKCNLLEQVFIWLRQGDLARSLGIWTRHQHEWASMLSAGVLSDLLSVIPDDVKACQLTTWLTSDLIPFIVTTIPKGLEVLLNWIIKKALNMELLEKDDWPVNAINFLKAVHQSGVASASINSAHQEATPSETVIKTQVNVGDALLALHAQVVKLEHLYTLHTTYKFHLTNDQFEQETTVSMAFRMLDKVVAIELMAPALRQQIRPYMAEHGLKEDHIFFQYIQDLLERSTCEVMYHGEAPWEAKAAAVIKYIKNPELKCESIYRVMKFASIPWTQEMQNLVQSGLKLDHPKVELLKNQCGVNRINEILLKYELKKLKVEDLGPSDIMRLLYFILSKDQPSSVEDALEVISLKGLTHSAQVDMYLFRLRFLVQTERGSEALALIRQLPTYLSETCAKRLVMFTEVVLSEPLRFAKQVEERRKALFAAAGSKVCSHLMEKLRDHLEISHYGEVKKEFDSILALQFEFGEVMVLPDYRDYGKREAVLKKLLQTSYLKKEQDKICVCYSKVFRLAGILQICRAKLLGELAIHSASSQHMDRAFHLCTLLLESESTEESGNTLHQVALSLSQLQDTLPAEGKLSVDLLRRLPDVIYELACQAVIVCSPELMNQCLLLCKVTDLWRKLCSQCESGDYSLAVQVSDSTSQDPYTVWNLDTCFREDALVLDSRLALPLASFVTSAHLKLVELCSNPTAFVTPGSVESCTDTAAGLLENLSRTTQDLTSYLGKNGHVGLAVEYLQLMTAVSAQFVMQQDMGYPNENKAVSAMFAQQCQTLSQIYSVGQSRIKEFTCSLLLKVLNERRIDQRLALAHFTCLPISQSLPLLKRSASSHGLNYKSLMLLAQVGIALSELSRNPASLARFRELEKNATWGHRISKYKINFREAFMAPSNMKTKLLTTMAQCEGISTAFIRDFCRAFQIEEDEGLFIYLDHLLLSPPPSTLDPNTLQQQQAQLARAKSAIQDIHMRDVLRERLYNLLDQINPYNYEVIVFILEELLMLPPVVVSDIEKGLKLLKHLKFYKRCAPPTEYEIKCSVTQESEELVRGVEWLHPLSKERLPYHPLMSEKPLKVIKPELNYSTITQWTPMADLLQIPSDSVIVSAIRNTVSQYLEMNSSRVAPGVDATKEKSLCNWELDDAGVELLRKLHELFMKLESCEYALACCVTSVIGALPIGAEKVLALQQCVNFAEMWYKASDPDSADREKAMQAYMKFSEFHRRLSTEQVLYQTRMAEPDLLQLATNPKALIKKLYQHPSILMHDGEIEGQRPEIHAIAKKIAAIHSLELDKVVNNLIMEWMPGGGSAEDDAEATMTFSFTNLDFAKEESVNEGEDCSLRRVIYLLQYQPLETSCQFIYHYVTNSKAEGVNRSNECLVRALRCLLELADDDTIERVCAQPANNIREWLEVLMYLVELEALHIQHSVDTFTQCSKEGLIKGIWQNHSHKKNAVQLVSDLCLDYKVHDVLLWNSLLQKLQAFGLSRKLESLLMRISGVKELWQIPSLPKVWYDLIFSFLTKGVPPLQGDQVRECVHAINLLMKCPCPEELDLEGLCGQCSRLEMYGCALSCVTLLIDRAKQVTLVQSVMSAGLTAVLTSLKKAEEGGLSATTISRVEEVLFVHTKLTGRFGEMWDSDRAPAFLSYLVEQRQVRGLIGFLQDNNRLTEAVEVVDIYLRQCPDVPVHLRAACHNKPPEVKLQIFMQSVATGNSVIPNGTA